MTCEFYALCLDATDPVALARFWAGLLGWELGDDPLDGAALLASDDTGFRLRFLPAATIGESHLHLHLTSTSLEDQHQTVERSLRLGARRADIGQRPDETFVVLADPEGNLFCVIEPGNNFLADCGFFGEVTCEGSRDVGLFWSDALGLPLGWDQNEETSIRSPHGGPKISWGGQPPTLGTAKHREHFEIAPPLGGDQHVEVDRLVLLGATRVDAAGHEAGGVAMADPDGRPFCVLTPR